jgi:hypothetical protein
MEMRRWRCDVLEIAEDTVWTENLEHFLRSCPIILIRNCFCDHKSILCGIPWMPPHVVE